MKGKECKNCKYWRMPRDNEYFGAKECAIPRDPINEWDYVEDIERQRELFGYATSYCTHPNIKFYERPEKNGACVADGSQYMAVFITGENFGCNMHESNN